VIDEEHHDGTDHSDEHAVEIKSGDAHRTALCEQKAANDRADDAENDIEDDSLACLVADLAGGESRDQPEDDLPENRHDRHLC
jgi:hypothetical protein